MKRKILGNAIICSIFIVTISFIPSPSMAKEEAAEVSNSSRYVDGSLCTKPDQIVFSCPLLKSKVVSICAAGSSKEIRFYYVFGRKNKIELTYPTQNDTGSKAINATKVAGSNSWSTAYSFKLQNNIYIVNIVKGMAFIGKSGKEGFRSPWQSGDLLVQKTGSDKADFVMSCQKNRIHSSEDLIEESSSVLSSDPSLKDGLPY